MTYEKGPYDGTPDPPDPDAVWAAVMAERAETFRGLVGDRLDEWLETRRKEEQNDTI